MKLESLLIVAAAAAPATGPVIVQLLGYDVPVLSAAFGVIGVVLAFELAPPPPRPLSPMQRMALRILAVLIVLALVIWDQKSPFVSLGWAIGVGMSTYTIIELLGALIPERLRALFGRAEAPDTQPESPEDQA